jgi:hypothetical protein
LYYVRIYQDRVPFQTAESGSLRMRMLLGFIEARVTVIDAAVKSDQHFHCLSVLCSTTAGPTLFSAIMRKTAPHAVIEEITESAAEDYISHRAVHEHSVSEIPFIPAIQRVHESRNALLSLLIEYRSLVSEFVALSGESTSVVRAPRDRGYSVPFLLFDQGGSVCALPDFQIEKITRNSSAPGVLHIGERYGKKPVVCDELLFMKEIDILQCSFRGKIRNGHYRISVPVSDGTFECTLVVPSFL